MRRSDEGGAAQTQGSICRTTYPTDSGHPRHQLGVVASRDVQALYDVDVIVS